MAAERYPNSASEKTVSLAKYVKRFVLAYIGISFLLMAIFMLINYDNPSVMGFIIVLCSGQLAGFAFFKDFQRRPEKSEKRFFGLYATIASMLISAVPLIYLISIDEPTIMPLKELPVAVSVLVTLISAGLAYLLSTFGFSQGARLQEKAENRKAEKAKL